MPSLKRVALNRVQFDGVKSVHSARRGSWRDACVSGERRNNADGRIWPTEGLVFRPAEHRYARLVVNQTTATSMPCQQTRKRGQMNPIECNTL